MCSRNTSLQWTHELLSGMQSFPLTRQHLNALATCLNGTLGTEPSLTDQITGKNPFRLWLRGAEVSLLLPAVSGSFSSCGVHLASPVYT